MDDSFSIFRKFATKEQALGLQDLLKEANIDSILGDNIPQVDHTFTGSKLQHEYEVRIDATDFEKAEKMLEQRVQDEIDQIDKDYYLFEFTDDELYEILQKPDEWNPYDYTLAQHLLKQKGKQVDKEHLEALKQERLDELAKPEKDQKVWIILGYILSILGGLLGVIIGYVLWTSKKTLPNGQKVYSFIENDRKHGKTIFYIGLVIFPISLLTRVFYLILTSN